MSHEHGWKFSKVKRAKREGEIGLDILVNTVSSADLGARYGGPGDEYDTNKLLSMVNAGFTEREEANESDSIEVYPGLLDAENADGSDVDSERGEDGERHGGHKKKKNKTKKVKQPKDKESFTKIINFILTKLFILFFHYLFLSVLEIRLFGALKKS